MSIEAFRGTASQWFAAQTEVPEGAWLSSGKIIGEECRFKVRAPVPNSTMEVDIFWLTVRADHSIQTEDRREYFRTIVADEHFGHRREERLISLLTAPGGDKPDWFVAAERTRPFLDRRGIDLFVRVKLTEDNLCQVPVQIKSSPKALEQYFRDRPEFKDIVVGFVVRDQYSDESLLVHFFDAVGEFRKRYAHLPLARVKALITTAIYQNK